MKQELKPVTTNLGYVIMLDGVKENWNIGDTILTSNIPFEVIKGIDRNYSAHFGYEYLITVEGNGNQYKPCEVYGKVVCQPIGSKLDGIPYYQTEEETGIYNRSDIHKFPSHYDIVKEADNRFETEQGQREFIDGGIWVLDKILTSLRKPRRIVSASVCMGKGCVHPNGIYTCRGTDDCTECELKPIRYTKEIDGKPETFLKLDIKYE